MDSEFDQSLEVEEMNESKELRERRQSMRQQLEHVVEVDATDKPVGDGDPFLEDGESISELFSGLGGFIRPLFTCFVVVLILSGLGYAGFRFLPDFSFEEFFKRTPAVTQIDPSVEPEDEVLDEDITLIPGILAGRNDRTLEVTTFLGAEAGDPSEDPEFFGESVEIFEAAYRTYQLNLPQFLNRADDREEAIDQYSSELRHALSLNNSRYETLLAHRASLQRAQSEVEAQSSEFEDDFSTRFQELDALGSEAALNRFISSAQSGVEIEAQLKAFNRLIDLYEELEPLLSARILDVDLNREALVKGVEVIDVENSDLDLILDESDLER